MNIQSATVDYRVEFVFADDTFTDLSLQLKVSKGKLSSLKFQEEVVEQVQNCKTVGGEYCGMDGRWF